MSDYANTLWYNIKVKIGVYAMFLINCGVIKMTGTGIVSVIFVS